MSALLYLKYLPWLSIHEARTGLSIINTPPGAFTALNHFQKSIKCFFWEFEGDFILFFVSLLRWDPELSPNSRNLSCSDREMRSSESAAIQVTLLCLLLSKSDFISQPSPFWLDLFLGTKGCYSLSFIWNALPWSFMKSIKIASVLKQETHHQKLYINI